MPRCRRNVPKSPKQSDYSRRARALIDAYAEKGPDPSDPNKGLVFFCNIVDAVDTNSVKAKIVQKFFFESVAAFEDNLRRTSKPWIAARAAFYDVAQNERERLRVTARFRWRSRDRVHSRYRAVHVCERKKLVRRYKLRDSERSVGENQNNPRVDAECAAALIEELNMRSAGPNPPMLGEEFNIFWATHESATAHCGDKAEGWCDLLGLPESGSLFKFAFRHSLSGTVARLRRGKQPGLVIRRPTFVEAIDQRFFRHRSDGRYTDGWGRSVHLESLMAPRRRGGPRNDGAPEIVIGELMAMRHFGDWNYVQLAGSERLVDGPSQKEILRIKYEKCVFRRRTQATIVRRLCQILGI